MSGRSRIEGQLASLTTQEIEYLINLGTSQAEQSETPQAVEERAEAIRRIIRKMLTPDDLPEESEHTEIPPEPSLITQLAMSAQAIAESLSAATTIEEWETFYILLGEIVELVIELKESARRVDEPGANEVS
jgi:hypothetical protein